METIIRNVRDLREPERSTLERLVGHELRQTQQLVIQIKGDGTEDRAIVQPAVGELPDWCRIYEGLSDAEIDDLDRLIVRTQSSRDVT